MSLFSIDVLLLRYFIFNKIIPVLLLEMNLLNKTHNKKEISKFVHTVLTFLNTTKIYLPLFEKILLTEPGACRT